MAQYCRIFQECCCYIQVRITPCVYSLYFTMGRPLPHPKIAHSPGEIRPSLHLKRHLRRFTHFCRADQCVQQTLAIGEHNKVQVSSIDVGRHGSASRQSAFSPIRTALTEVLLTALQSVDDKNCSEDLANLM